MNHSVPFCGNHGRPVTKVPGVSNIGAFEGISFKGHRLLDDQVTSHVEQELGYFFHHMDLYSFRLHRAEVVVSCHTYIISD